MVIKGYNKYSISLKSLLVIVVLQLIILPLQASISLDLNQEPCDHSLMADGRTTHHGSNTEHNLNNSSDSASEFCPHCEKASLDCDNRCHTSSSMFLTYNLDIDLDNFDSFYYIEKNKNLLAVSQQPKLRPPR